MEDNLIDKLAMQQTLEIDELISKDENEESLVRKTNKAMRSNKCNQCDFVSSQAGPLRTHLKTHGEKQNKCNQCDYASSQASNLRTHSKTHSGEKSNNCNVTLHAG